MKEFLFGLISAMILNSFQINIASASCFSCKPFVNYEKEQIKLLLYQRCKGESDDCALQMKALRKQHPKLTVEVCEDILNEIEELEIDNDKKFTLPEFMSQFGMRATFRVGFVQNKT